MGGWPKCLIKGQCVEVGFAEGALIRLGIEVMIIRRGRGCCRGGTLLLSEELGGGVCGEVGCVWRGGGGGYTAVRGVFRCWSTWTFDGPTIYMSLGLQLAPLHRTMLLMVMQDLVCVPVCTDFSLCIGACISLYRRPVLATEFAPEVSLSLCIRTYALRPNAQRCTQCGNQHSFAVLHTGPKALREAAAVAAKRKAEAAAGSEAPAQRRRLSHASPADAAATAGGSQRGAAPRAGQHSGGSDHAENSASAAATASVLRWQDGAAGLLKGDNEQQAQGIDAMNV